MKKIREMVVILLLVLITPGMAATYTTFAWDYGQAPNIMFYVKWGTASKNYRWAFTTVSTTTSIMLPKGTYYIVVTAMDTQNNLESVPSNEVKFVTK
jgi:hypothetical protein